jgi:hypothetical protein
VAEGTGQPCLAAAGRADDQQIVLGRDPAAVGKAEEQGLVEATWRAEVDVLDRGLETELGLAQPGLVALGGAQVTVVWRPRRGLRTWLATRWPASKISTVVAVKRASRGRRVR